jgi:hypothetical protein
MDNIVLLGGTIIKPKENLCDDSERVSLSQIVSYLKDNDERIEKH